MEGCKYRVCLSHWRIIAEKFWYINLVTVLGSISWEICWLLQCFFFFPPFVLVSLIVSFLWGRGIYDIFLCYSCFQMANMRLFDFLLFHWLSPWKGWGICCPKEVSFMSSFAWILFHSSVNIFPLSFFFLISLLSLS